MDLKAVKSALATQSDEMNKLPAHVAAFCSYISPWQRSQEQMIATDHSLNYQNTAAIGFRLAAGLDEPNLGNAFSKGATQLAGRKYFTRNRAPRFEIDAVAMLGMAIGYTAIRASPNEFKWLRDCLEQSSRTLRDDTWQCSFSDAARAVLDGATDFSDVDPVMSVSLKTALSIATTDDERTAAWACLIDGIGDSDMTRISALQSVYEVCAAALTRLPVKGAGVLELVKLLIGVSESMSHWTYESNRRVKGVAPQVWEIDHEYHVQNLLWTVLRPVFPDLVDEETLSKLGHTSPRYDLGVPSLHTIIEVKYMRRLGQSELRKIANEVAADHSLYLRKGSGYSKIVVFIWDETRQTEEHKTLRNGLESLEGIERVIILSRPSRMERENGNRARHI
ncbi:MAG: hypothetical protein OXE85_13550 [Roseovarius sp.]|nr:hypothetical protein [Roseovarius sp.]